MKVTSEHYAIIEDRIQDVLVAKRHTLPGLWDKYQSWNLSHERMRWDLFWAAKVPFDVTKEYKDSHIDTALRRITHAGDVEETR